MREISRQLGDLLHLLGNYPQAGDHRSWSSFSSPSRSTASRSRAFPRAAERPQANLPNQAHRTVGARLEHGTYAQLPAKTNVIAYISSVADQSGGNDSCAAPDDSLPLTDTAMDSWSAARWISRIAVADNLLIGGENPGYGLPASLDSFYVNTSSAGMMASAIRQARTCNFKVFYWAHDIHLWDGTIPFSTYASMIAG